MCTRLAVLPAARLTGDAQLRREMVTLICARTSPYTSLTQPDTIVTKVKQVKGDVAFNCLLCVRLFSRRHVLRSNFPDGGIIYSRHFVYISKLGVPHVSLITTSIVAVPPFAHSQAEA